MAGVIYQILIQLLCPVWLGSRRSRGFDSVGHSQAAHFKVSTKLGQVLQAAVQNTSVPTTDFPLPAFDTGKIKLLPPDD